MVKVAAAVGCSEADNERRLRDMVGDIVALAKGYDDSCGIRVGAGVTALDET